MGGIVITTGTATWHVIGPSNSLLEPFWTMMAMCRRCCCVQWALAHCCYCPEGSKGALQTLQLLVLFWILLSLYSLKTDRSWSPTCTLNLWKGCQRWSVHVGDQLLVKTARGRDRHRLGRRRSRAVGRSVCLLLRSTNSSPTALPSLNFSQHSPRPTYSLYPTAILPGTEEHLSRYLFIRLKLKSIAQCFKYLLYSVLLFL